jgi:hypothetical protein
MVRRFAAEVRLLRPRVARSTYTLRQINLNSGHMTNQPASEINRLRQAYAAFNSRDIDAALALMTPDVAWPRAFKGGFVQGPQAVRAYWTEQWSEINPHVEPVAFHQERSGRILVEVHQLVRDLAGTVLADEYVCGSSLHHGGWPDPEDGSLCTSRAQPQRLTSQWSGRLRAARSGAAQRRFS